MSHIIRKLAVKKSDEDGAVEPTAFINSDVMPLPPARRTWGPGAFAGLWLVCNVSLSNWTMGSALVGLGLNVSQSLGAIIAGNIIVALCVVLTGAPGAKWHIPFAVVNRSAWGIYGFFFPLVNRMILNFTWHATQSYYGARCLRVAIGSIWPSYYRLDKSLAGGTLDTSTIVAFVLFTLVQLPLVYLRPERYRKPFFIVSVLVCITCVAFLIWAMVVAGGAGALVSDASSVAGVKAVHGSDYHWAMMYGVTTTLGSICAGMLNQSDFTRYARKPSDPVLAQLISIPLGRILCAAIGIIVTSCAAQWWPEKGLLWMPPDLLEQLQSTGEGRTRVAVFFVALVFTVSQLCANTAENATPSGIDLSCFLPKVFTIRRGAYLTVAASIAIQPWQMLNGSSVYLLVMGSYSVFIAPLTGLMVADYFIVRKRTYMLTHLYDASPSCIYYYASGLNWRAVIAWAFGVVPAFPGFVRYVQNGGLANHRGGATHLFEICWLLGFALSFVVHSLLGLLWPPKGVGSTDESDVYGTFASTVDDAEAQSNTDSASEKKAPEMTGQVTVHELRKKSL